jgi:hypothetical protein
VTTLHLIPCGPDAVPPPPPDPVRYPYARYLMALLSASESVASDLASHELLWLVNNTIVADAISYPLDMLVEAAAVDEGYVPCGWCRAWGHRESMTGSDFVGWRCWECVE